MADATKRTKLFEPSTDRKVLANFLKKRMVEDGAEFVSYAELSAAIGGRNVQNGARHLLLGAVADLLREHHIMAVTVRNEGIRRSQDAAGCLDQKVGHIARAARRAGRQCGHVLADEQLNNEQRVKVLARAAQFGALSHFCGNRAQKQIEGMIDQKTPKEVALLPTIDAIRSQFTK